MAMMGTDSKMMQMLQTQMRYMTQRQTVLSENIANLDTPGYTVKELKKLDFEKMAGAESQRLAMRPASAGATMQGSIPTGAYRADEQRKTYETTPMKNNVSLDEEMAKISETGGHYQISSSLFKKYTGMYRAALGNK